MVGPGEETYKLTVGGHAGELKDAMVYHNGMKSTTKDQDNDKWEKNCANAEPLKCYWWSGGQPFDSQ